MLGRFTYSIVVNCIKKKRIKYSSILIFAPHPDDEIIGLGGLILQTLKNGGDVFICYITDGEKSNSYPDQREIKKQRKNLTSKVLEKLKIQNKNIFKLHLEDGKVPHKMDLNFKSVVLKFRDIIEIVKPEAVFATAESDFWPYDHVASAQITKEAVNSSKHKTELWFYWVWTWYHIKPWNIFKLKIDSTFKINIKPELKIKKELIKMYLEPVSPENIPWSGELPKSMIEPFYKPYEIIERYD